MSAKRYRCVALIPARAGSKRLANKNIRFLAGHPLLAYSIAAAQASGVFDAVVVSTDSEHYAQIARHYGAEVPFLRPKHLSGCTSPDIEWVDFSLRGLIAQGHEFDCFSILRPTSPFRQAETIKRAWRIFRAEQGIDSLRAVEPCSQHPGKMWVVEGRRLHPLLPNGPRHPPWHSSQYAALPLVHVQNASLEIAWTRVVLEDGCIAGQVLMPFFTDSMEGMDINTPEDWWYVNHLLEQGQASLPVVNTPGFRDNNIYQA